MKRGAAVAVALAAALVMACPASAVAEPMLFGFSDGSSIFPYEGSASAEQIAALEAGAGAEAGRLTVRWEEIQPTEPPVVGPPRYDWSKVDELAEAQRKAGVAPLPMLLGAPAWAREPGCSGVCPPAAERFADWRSFVAAAAHRFDHAIALEIWNEPNLKAYWPLDGGPDPAAYAALFDAASIAAGRVAPGLRLLSGGLSYVEEAGIAEGNMAVNEYLTGFFGAAQAPRLTDPDTFGVGLHVYPSPGGGTPDGRVAGALAQARTTAGGSPIWVTEFGASTTAPDATTGGSVSPETQTKLILEALDEFEAQPDVAAAFVYTLIDRLPASGEAVGEEGFGVVTRGPDFAPKPAYCALAERNGRPLPDGCPTA